MNHLVRLAVGTAAVAAVLLGGAWVCAQPPAAKPAAPPAAKPVAVAVPTVTPAADAGAAAPLYRNLAPGVMEPIDEEKQYRTTYSIHTVTELAEFDWAQDATFRHNVWALDFQFKPMRMIWVDLPAPGERMQRKLVWYLVYSVTNPGKVYHPVEGKDGTYDVVTVDKPLRFIQTITMEVHNRIQDEAAGFTKVYSAKYLPLAVDAIRAREDRNRKFLSSYEMSAKQIAVGETVWGVATWEDIDPRVVWFSVYVEGLTNALRWKDDPAKYAAVLKGTESGSYRTMFGKVLKVNFWRPGDEFLLTENQVRLGVPGQAGKRGLPPCEWIWRRAF
ncbi:MAG: hypothetical protein ABR915_22200 [Thermoguttaceae bacterium]|jgi:hypothetical protein